MFFKTSFLYQLQVNKWAWHKSHNKLCWHEAELEFLVIHLIFRRIFDWCLLQFVSQLYIYFLLSDTYYHSFVVINLICCSQVHDSFAARLSYCAVWSKPISQYILIMTWIQKRESKYVDMLAWKSDIRIPYTKQTNIWRWTVWWRLCMFQMETFHWNKGKTSICFPVPFIKCPKWHTIIILILRSCSLHWKQKWHRWWQAKYLYLCVSA